LSIIAALFQGSLVQRDLSAKLIEALSVPLTYSLLIRRLVLSPTASFLSTSGKKRGKETPQGTDGSLTSLRGRRAERQGLLQPRELVFSSFCGKMWH